MAYYFPNVLGVGDCHSLSLNHGICRTSVWDIDITTDMILVVNIYVNNWAFNFLVFVVFILACLCDKVINLVQRVRFELTLSGSSIQHSTKLSYRCVDFGEPDGVDPSYLGTSCQRIDHNCFSSNFKWLFGIVFNIWGERWESNPHLFGSQSKALPLSYEHHNLIHTNTLR